MLADVDKEGVKSLYDSPASSPSDASDTTADYSAASAPAPTQDPDSQSVSITAEEEVAGWTPAIVAPEDEDEEVEMEEEEEEVLLEEKDVAGYVWSLEVTPKDGTSEKIRSVVKFTQEEGDKRKTLWGPLVYGSWTLDETRFQFTASKGLGFGDQETYIANPSDVSVSNDLRLAVRGRMRKFSVLSALTDIGEFVMLRNRADEATAK